MDLTLEVSASDNHAKESRNDNVPNGELLTTNRDSQFQVYVPSNSFRKDTQDLKDEGNFSSTVSKCCRNACRIFFGQKEKWRCPDVLYRYLPVTKWIRQYDVKRYAFRDLIAGLTVGTLAVPQALGYASVAGVFPVFGLYTSFICPLIYFFLGTSHHASVGTFSLVALMCGETVRKITSRSQMDDWKNSLHRSINSTENSNLSLNTGLQANASQIASTLAITVGLWQLVLGIVGLGYVTVYLSDRVVKAFSSGASVHIFCTQLNWIFGLKIPKRQGFFNLFYLLWDLFRSLPHAPLATCLVSLVCTVALILGKVINDNPRVKKVIPFPIPMELLVIIFASLASYLMNLNAEYGVDTIKHIPLGLPIPQVPDFSLIPELIGDAFFIALIAFAMAVSASRIFEKKHNYQIDGNQELRALGTSGIFSGIFQGFPCGVALARSMVQESVGGATQVVSLLMSGVVALVITCLGPFLEPIPRASLGCIIVVALWHSLIGVLDIRRLWKLSRLEALIFGITYLSIIILDVEIGLLIGVLVSLFATIIFGSQIPRVDTLVPREIYSSSHAVNNSVRIIRFSGPLYFANAEIQLKTAQEKINTRKEKPKKLDENGTVENLLLERSDENFGIIIDMVAVTFIDLSGVEVLKKLYKENVARSGFCLASTKESIQKMLVRCDFIPEKDKSDLFFETVNDAVIFLNNLSIFKRI